MSGAAGGRAQPAAAPHVMEHLQVGPGGVRLLPQRHDLPQQHPERPHVRLAGEHAVHQGLGGHPPHRQQALPLLAVVVVLVDVTGQAKVA